MKTALTLRRGTTVPAALRSTYERLGAINWTRISPLLEADFDPCIGSRRHYHAQSSTPHK